MPRSNLSLLSEQRHSTARYVDLCSEVVHVKNSWWDRRGPDVGDTVMRVGGKWDRRLSRWHSDADGVRRIYVHDGQEEAAYFLRDWLTAFVSGDELEPIPIYTMMFGGPRRSAKSHLAFNFAAAVFPIAVCRANVWIVTPEHEQDEGEEVQKTVKSTIPTAWYGWKGNPKRVFTLHNRSKIWLRSARSNLKKGGADLILLNEAQQMPVRAYRQSRGAIVDNGGLVMPIANPPDEEEYAGGDWVDDLVDGCKGGKRPNAKVFHFQWELNPEIDHKSLDAMDHDITDADALLRDKKGVFGLRRNRAYHQFSEARNTGPVPDFPPVTQSVLKKHFGRPFMKLIRCDFQRTPHQAAVVTDFFVNPDDPNDPDEWIVDYVIVANGDEDDLIDGLEEKGYHGDECVVVADASGEWQFADRDKVKSPGWSGSFDMFRRRGWRFIYPPDQQMKRNPLIASRMAVTNSRFCDHLGKRHLYISEELARVIEACKKWPSKKGMPSRHSKHAHIGDCIGYGCWRLYPRKSGPGKVTKMKAERGRSGRSKSFDGAW